MVFEPAIAPREPDAFYAWYARQTAWNEPHDYNDPGVTSPRLAAWFAEMIRSFPPMNGPLRRDGGDLEVTDYSIGRAVIYAAFCWPLAEDAYNTVRRLASLHDVGFFDVSGDSEIWFPDR